MAKKRKKKDTKPIYGSLMPDGFEFDASKVTQTERMSGDVDPVDIPKEKPPKAINPNSRDGRRQALLDGMTGTDTITKDVGQFEAEAKNNSTKGNGMGGKRKDWNNSNYNPNNYVPDPPPAPAPVPLETPMQQNLFGGEQQFSLFDDADSSFQGPSPASNQSQQLFEADYNNKLSAFENPNTLREFKETNGKDYFDETRFMSDDDIEFLSSIDSNFEAQAKGPKAPEQMSLDLDELDSPQIQRTIERAETAEVFRDVNSISSESGVLGNMTDDTIPSKPTIMNKIQDIKSGKANSPVANVADDLVDNKAAQEGLEGMFKGMTKSKVGKTIAGVGVAALLVSNMNKSKGQQSNQELYGQRTPYM